MKLFIYGRPKDVRDIEEILKTKGFKEEDLIINNPILKPYSVSIKCYSQREYECEKCLTTDPQTINDCTTFSTCRKHYHNRGNKIVDELTKNLNVTYTINNDNSIQELTFQLEKILLNLKNDGII